MTAVDRLMDLPWLYRCWQLPYAATKFAPILAHNDLSAVRSVLDVGCGPGTNAKYFLETQYCGIDCNEKYVRFARRRYGERFSVADVRDRTVAWPQSFDFVLVNSLLHHLADEHVHPLLATLSEVLTDDGHVHILDLVAGDPRTVAGRLSRADRGSFARPQHAWQQIFEAHFEPVVVVPYALRFCGMPLWHMVYFKGRAKR